MNHSPAFSTPSCLGHVSYLDLAHTVQQFARPLASQPGPAASAAALGAAGHPLRFVLHQAPGRAAGLHLVVLCHGQRIAHWVLPDSPLPQPFLQPRAYLVEAPASLPVPDQIIDGGSCVLPNHTADQVFFLEQDLRQGYLQLTLRGRQLHSTFSLERLHPQSLTWELALIRQLPPQHVQAVA